MEADQLDDVTAIEAKDGDVRWTRANFEKELAGEFYGPLRDSKTFDRVRLDPEVHTLVWPNGADFDPAILHDWPKHLRAFTLAARRWELTHVSKRQAA